MELLNSFYVAFLYFSYSIKRLCQVQMFKVKLLKVRTIQ